MATEYLHTNRPRADLGAGVDLEEVLASESGADMVGHELPLRYDFNRPNSISRTLDKNLRAVGESFAERLSIDFTRLMRSSTEVGFEDLSQCSFGEFQKGMPQPTCAAVVKLEPLGGTSLVHLDLSLGYRLLQKLLGGALGDAAPEREFTEIERQINADLVKRIIEILRQSMAKWTELQPSLVKLENNPLYLGGMTAGESLIVLGFWLQAGPAEGRLELAFPLSAFERIGEALGAQETVEPRSARELQDDRRRILNTVREANSELVVVLSTYDARLEDILNLSEGDTLRLPQAAESPLRVQVAGRDAWLGKAVRVGQSRAVKLVRQLNKE